MLGIIYKIFGRNFFYVVFLQIILSVFSGILVFKLCLNLFNLSVANIALSIFSLNLGYLIYSQLILADVVTSFLLLLFLMLLLLNSKHSFFLSGICGGLSVLIKPAALYYPILVSPILIFFKKESIKKCSNLYLFLFSFYFPIVLLIIYNKIHHDYLGISKVMNVNLFQLYVPRLVNLINEKHNLYLKINNFYSLAMVSIKYPVEFIGLWMVNVFKTLFGIFSIELKMLLIQKYWGRIYLFLEKIIIHFFLDFLYI